MVSESVNMAEVMRLPATVIQRIVKDAVPANAAFSKEARAAVGRAASVFIMNLVTASNDFATSRKRKQITAEDVFQGVKVLESDRIIDHLKEAVELWKVVKAQKNEEAKKRKLEKNNEGTPLADEEDGHEEQREERLETPAEDDEEEEEDVLDDDVAQESTESSQDEDDVSQEIDLTPSPAGTDEARDIEDF